MLGTHLGGDFKIGGLSFGTSDKSGGGVGASIGAGRRNFNESRTMSQRDIIYGIAKDILTRENWTSQEKAQHLNKLNGSLLHGDFFNPNRLPTNNEMMSAGGLDREQTSMSEKFQTSNERQRTNAEFKTHPEKFAPFIRSMTPPDGDT